MPRHARLLVVVLWSAILAGAGAYAAEAQPASQPPQPASQAPPPPPLAAPSNVVPIPNQPPITTSGVLKSFDRATMLLTFEDGRVVKIGPQTRLARSVGGRLCSGELVIVTNAIPVGVTRS